MWIPRSQNQLFRTLYRDPSLEPRPRLDWRGHLHYVARSCIWNIVKGGNCYMFFILECHLQVSAYKGRKDLAISLYRTFSKVPKVLIQWPGQILLRTIGYIDLQFHTACLDGKLFQWHRLVSNFMVGTFIWMLKHPKLICDPILSINRMFW